MKHQGQPLMQRFLRDGLVLGFGQGRDHVGFSSASLYHQAMGYLIQPV
jgi:hypothetical protein